MSRKNTQHGSSRDRVNALWGSMNQIASVGALVFCCAVTGMAQGLTQSEDRSTTAKGTAGSGGIEQDIEGKSVSYWVEQLANEHYLRRELASKRLVSAGPRVVDSLAAAIRKGDLEVVERAAAAMIEIAIAVPPRSDGGAFERLGELSTQSIGRPASIARGALAEVKKHRSRQARRALVQAGVFVGLADFAIGAQSRQRMLVEIGDGWNRDLSALQWLEWLDGYDNARVEGGAAQAAVLAEVSQLPDLRSLILVDAEIDGSVLIPLTEMQRLDTLDFRYVKLLESSVDLLTKVPLRTSLILMGTGLSEERAEILRDNLPGLQIEFRRGGFLGVMCIDNFDVCEITGIQENSAAEAAGLMRGDIITDVNGTEIKHFRDLQRAINEHLPGEEVELMYRRGGEEKSLSLVLRRYQES